jgi:hypothetical protein
MGLPFEPAITDGRSILIVRACLEVDDMPVGATRINEERRRRRAISAAAVTLTLPLRDPSLSIVRPREASAARHQEQVPRRLQAQRSERRAALRAQDRPDVRPSLPLSLRIRRLLRLARLAQPLLLRPLP